uniref:Uncharacterized protein n=1 Tax=Anguilla anguilla TaxID=7936 RepID=A0A0E9Q7W3_ANGAN
MGPSKQPSAINSRCNVNRLLKIKNTCAFFCLFCFIISQLIKSIQMIIVLFAVMGETTI